MGNEDVVRKFLASKAFDFEAFGKFVAQNGASLAISEDSEFGFVIGPRIIRYCIPPVTKGFGEVEEVAGE
jgi:hypothetical protein